MDDTEEIALVESGPTMEVWKGSKGIMRLDWTDTGVVRITPVGYGHGDFANAINRVLEAASNKHGQFTIVGDWTGMSGYDSEFRSIQQEWMDKHKSSWKGSHAMFKSKLVVMGVQVAVMILGGNVKAYSNLEEFEKVCDELGLPKLPPLSVPK